MTLNSLPGISPLILNLLKDDPELVAKGIPGNRTKLLLRTGRRFLIRYQFPSRRIRG